MIRKMLIKKDIENRHFRDKNLNLVLVLSTSVTKTQSALDKKETMKQHAQDKNASKYKKNR